MATLDPFYVDLLRKMKQSTDISRQTTLAGAVLAIFDWIICMDREINFVWLRPWTIAKGLYIFNRYVTVSLLTAFTGMFVYANPTTSLCDHWGKLEAAAGTVSQMSFHVSLGYRVYASWNQSPWILGILGLGILTEAAFSATILGVHFSQAILTTEPFMPAFAMPYKGCTTLNVHPMFFSYWFPFLAFECLAVVLILTRAYQELRHRKGVRTTGQTLLMIITRDSLLYFLFLSSTHLVCALIWIRASTSSDPADATATQSTVGFALALPSSLISRLLLNIREAAFKEEQARNQPIDVEAITSGRRSRADDSKTETHQLGPISQRTSQNPIKKMIGAVTSPHSPFWSTGEGTRDLDYGDFARTRQVQSAGGDVAFERSFQEKSRNGHYDEEATAGLSEPKSPNSWGTGLRTDDASFISDTKSEEHYYDVKRFAGRI